MNPRLWYCWRGFAVFFHLIVAVIFGFTLYYESTFTLSFKDFNKNASNELTDKNNYSAIQSDSRNDNNSIEELFLNRTKKGSFGWKWKYLTYWDLVFQFLMFTIIFLCDCHPNNYQSHKEVLSKSIRTVFRIRDTLFHGIAFPLGWFVCSTFWIIYAINRELIFPSFLDGKYPALLNHATHTIIAPILLIETIVTYHRIPHKIVGISLVVGVSLTYLLWTLYIGLVHDYWVYAVVKVLSWPLRIAFFGGCTLAVMTLYLLGVYLHQFLWPEKRKYIYFTRHWKSNVKICTDHEFEDFRVVQGLIKSKA